MNTYACVLVHYFITDFDVVITLTQADGQLNSFDAKEEEEEEEEEDKKKRKLSASSCMMSSYIPL